MRRYRIRLLAWVVAIRRWFGYGWQMCEIGSQSAIKSALKNSQDVDLLNKMSEFPGLDLQLYLSEAAVSCRFRRGFDGSTFPAGAGAGHVPAPAR
ncbi:hypothetical protein THIARS_80263 [Thiomonas delicata]|uniref:Uncharacterized protein n=1 Tax=Thiomonas delicata TaxID=364030 RepID=A0A238D927_THIDL|nr:hypothetical protein THIARS_80263 [Thiomonas delicata]